MPRLQREDRDKLKTIQNLLCIFFTGKSAHKFETITIVTKNTHNNNYTKVFPQNQGLCQVILFNFYLFFGYSCSIHLSLNS